MNIHLKFAKKNFLFFLNFIIVPVGGIEESTDKIVSLRGVHSNSSPFSLKSKNKKKSLNLYLKFHGRPKK